MYAYLISILNHFLIIYRGTRKEISLKIRLGREGVRREGARGRRRISWWEKRV